MGCDIHIYTEFLKEGQWHTGDIWRKSRYDDEGDRKEIPSRFRAFNSRNYNFFAWLADVRNGTWGEAIPVITAPKGVPADCCAEITAEKVRWDSDGHSHSWLTLAELEAAWERDKEMPIAFEGAVNDQDPKIVAWLALPVSSRGQPPSFCASGSCYGKPYPLAKWSVPLSDRISTAYNSVHKFLWNLKWDENAEDVRAVFWFDN